MTTAPRRTAASPLRVGFGVATLTLAIAILVGLKAPQDGTLGAAVSGGGAGTGIDTGTSSGTDPGRSSGSSAAPSVAAPGGVSGNGATTDGATVDGSLVETRYGPVEVEITIAAGKVATVTAIELPSGGRSGAISNYAAPILSSEALSAQSAQIDLVSGATYTSEAYAQSLQAALDQAGL